MELINVLLLLLITSIGAMGIFYLVVVNEWFGDSPRAPHIASIVYIVLVIIGFKYYVM